jgi:hypothetical protein
MSVDHLIVPIPLPGDRPSRFRREFILSIKVAVQKAFRSGRIDAALAEECWRSLPSFSRRR